MEKLMENDFFQSKLGLALRWLLFLPTALLVAVFTGFVVRLAQASTGNASIIAASAMSAGAFKCQPLHIATFMGHKMNQLQNK